MPERKVPLVQAVDRSLAILEAMAREGEPMALGEISAEVELTRSTVHRLLATLISRGFARQDAASGRYSLGFKALEVGTSFLTSLDIRTLSRQYLRDLAEECGETVNLAVLEGLDVVYIAQVEAERIVKMRARLGSRGPAYCTGSGKVLLAGLSDDELDKLLQGRVFKRFTTRTITDPARLRTELSNVRKSGYALDYGEMEPEVRCAAAPVYDYEGRAVYAVSVSGPSTRVEGEYLRAVLVPAVIKTAGDITRELGGRSPRLSGLTGSRQEGLRRRPVSLRG